MRKTLSLIITAVLLSGLTIVGLGSPAVAAAVGTISVTPLDKVQPGQTGGTAIDVSFTTLPVDASKFTVSLTGVQTADQGTASVQPTGGWSNSPVSGIQLWSEFRQPNYFYAQYSLTVASNSVTVERTSAAGSEGSVFKIRISSPLYAASGPYQIVASYDSATDGGLSRTFTLTPQTFNAIFQDNSGGSATGSMPAQSASSPTALNANAFVRAGYTFAGWATSSSGSVVYADQAVFPFSSSMLLYAVWTPLPQQTVTFNGNGATSGAMSNQSSSQPDYLRINAFVRTGYTFAGWSTSSTGTVEYTNTAQYPFTTSATLYAVWTQNAVQTKTVTFNANGGGGTTMANQVASSATNLSKNTFTRTGYSFAGWSTSQAGTVMYADEASYPFTSDTTLYAVWTATAPTTYTVTFNANGGSGLMLTQSEASATALSPNAFVRSGYTFAGWNTAANGSGTRYADSASYPFTSSATLYAQWTATGADSVSAPSATVELGVPVGGFIPGSTTVITAQGLATSAPYDIVMRSTPQTLSSGMAVSGAVNTQVTMPANVEAGWHSLTFSSTAADGTAFSQMLYFLVSDSSTLVATSSTPPVGLASTGSNSADLGGFALLTLLLGAGLIGVRTAHRRRAAVN